MNAIEIKNLHFSYGKENVLDGVSLCLKEGRLAILAGENGAGKSTLLRLLLGELPCQLLGSQAQCREDAGPDSV